MGNLRMNADQISYKGGEKPMSVEQAIKNAGNTGLAHTADIALDFSTESAYSAGDFVYHNGTLYVFTADHVAGAWSTSDTQVVTVGGEISTLMSGLTSVNNRLATVSLTYDDQDEIYPVPADKKPTDDLPITCTARNRQTGALYLLWYNGGAGGFKVGHVISGSAPTANQTAVVQYFI